MNLPTIVLICTIVLTLVGVLAALIAHLRAAGPRVVTAALGFTLLPFGLWLTGVMDLLGNGLRSLVQWYRGQHLDPMLVSGLVLLGVGLLMMLTSRVIKPRTSQDRKAVRALRSPRGGVPTGQPAVTAGDTPAGQGAGPATKPAAAKPAAADAEDDEIEALLRKRGIE